MEEYSKYLAKGEQKSTRNKLSGHARNQDQGDPLIEGDVFTIPNDFMNVTFDNTNLQDIDGNAVQFILCDCTNSVTGSKKKVKIYPNQFAKVIWPVEPVNGEPKLKTSGEVTSAYLSHLGEEDDMHQGITAIAGRAIRVAKDTPVKTKRFQSEEVYTTHLYEYVWA